MPQKKLYTELLEAYSEKNLNALTGKLISLYKSKQYDKIREIANRVSQFVPINEESDARCFSKLIMLYHPDKGEQNRTNIRTFYNENKTTQLKSFSHIFTLPDFDAIQPSINDVDIDYRPEYIWDTEADDGYSFEYDVNNTQVYDLTDFEKSFYNAIKIREYGRIDIEFPPYYLEDFEEFEMAYAGLESLSGIEHCIHAKSLILSDNDLVDLSELRDLKNVEELYLANNQIGIIDTLNMLLNLRILDISGNDVNDISALSDLACLEYVNLIGNPVPLEQIETLKAKGVLVMHE